MNRFDRAVDSLFTFCMAVLILLGTASIVVCALGFALVPWKAGM